MRLAVIQMVPDAHERAESDRSALLSLALPCVGCVAFCLVTGIPCDIPLALAALLIGAYVGIGSAISDGSRWRG